MARQLIVYVHGVIPTRVASCHCNCYEDLRQGIKLALPPGDRRAEWDGAMECEVEWGWNWNASPDPASHELLTGAQFCLGERVEATIRAEQDPTINPMRWAIDRLRPTFLYGFSDIFYYVSAEGKEAIRTALVAQMMTCIQNLETYGPDNPLELTLIGHSAGSVVAYDLLFYLFRKEPAAFVHAHAVQQDVDRLRYAAGQGALRVRRLITLGSPISMIACRSDAVLKVLHQNRRLDTSDYGLTEHPPASGHRAPRWINFWDKDDPISWPVQPLMKDDGSVEDVYGVSDSVLGAHGKYWTAGSVHRAIAEKW